MEKLLQALSRGQRTELKFELSLKIQNLPVEFKTYLLLIETNKEPSLHNSVYDIIKNYLTLDEPEDVLSS